MGYLNGEKVLPRALLAFLAARTAAGSGENLRRAGAARLNGITKSAAGTSPARQ